MFLCQTCKSGKYNLRKHAYDFCLESKFYLNHLFENTNVFNSKCIYVYYTSKSNEKNNEYDRFYHLIYFYMSFKNVIKFVLHVTHLFPIKSNFISSGCIYILYNVYLPKE